MMGRSKVVQPLFACTFSCPVCGEEMEHEHLGCEAKVKLLEKEAAHLRLSLVELSAQITVDSVQLAVGEGGRQGLEVVKEQVTRDVYRRIEEERRSMSPFRSLY